MMAEAPAATVIVGTCSNAFAQYPTIQQAVNAVPTGSTIYVCPGKWPEQVIINKGLNLNGAPIPPAVGAAVVVAPSTGIVNDGVSLSSGNPIAPQILVTNVPSPQKVNISNLTVDGSNSQIGDCSVDLMGIVYQNASGKISNSAALNEIPAPSLIGCQTGLGIFIQTDGMGGASTVTVSNTVVQNYAKNGITADELGVTATITGNTVTGFGPTPNVAQNGIQLGFGAAGSISGNTVYDDVYSGDPNVAISTGVLIYASPNVTISNNTVGNTQDSIAVFSDVSLGNADHTSITGNKVNTTHLFDGIDACSSSNTITGNTVNGSDEAGIHLDALCTGTSTGNTAKNNTINSACAGVLFGTAGNVITPNTYYNVVTSTVSGDACTPPPGRRHGKLAAKAVRP
jgi:parallel beta-helix repeat protein